MGEHRRDEDDGGELVAFGQHVDDADRLRPALRADGNADRSRDRPDDDERRVVDGAGDEIAPGPPVIFLAGPWLLLGLMLIGPFALLVTFVVVGLIAAALLVTLVAIFAAPYVLVRRLHRRYWASQAISVPATRVASLHSPRVAA